MRGRHPKPTAQKLLNNPGRRPIPNNPKAPPGAPRCPSWLPEEAKREWRRVAPILDAAGVLTVMDADTLAVYVSEVARYRSAIETLAKEGQTYKSDGGLIKRHPASAVAGEALRNVVTIAQQFGLTPLARQRLDVKKPITPVNFRDRYGLGGEGKSRFFPDAPAMRIDTSDHTPKRGTA